MAETETGGAKPEEEVDAFDELYGVTGDLVDAVEEAIADGHTYELLALIEPLHAADLADLLEQITPDEREAVIHALGDQLGPEVITYLDEEIRESILSLLNPAQIAQVVSELDSDDVVDLIEDLDEADQKKILDAIPEDERALYEQSLSFPEESAGRLMRREVFTIPGFWTVGQTIDHMRDDTSDLPDDFYNIVVVDPSHKPVGLMPLSRMMRSPRTTPIADIMQAEPKIIPVGMNQEDAAFIFRQYGLVEAPVVDDAGRLVGVITVDDIVNVMDEEYEDDILKLGGVSSDDFYSDVMVTTRRRVPWLVLNLGTAFIASFVISFFTDTIDHVVALAVLMPIVAGMGGNAGTQTMTVAVRALATNQLTPSNALRIVGKEVLVGGANGIIFAILVGLIAWGWFSNPLLGLVIACAMIANLVVAGLAGAMIPLAIDRAGLDPAISSSVFLTTVTDVVGFFVFLGLATLILI